MFNRILFFILISWTISAQLYAQKPPYMLRGSIHGLNWCGTGYRDIQLIEGNGHAHDNGTTSLLCHYLTPKAGITWWQVYYDGDISSPTVGLSYINSSNQRTAVTRAASNGTSSGLEVTSITQSYALQITGYYNGDVLCKGSSIRLKTSGTASTTGWYTHLKVRLGNGGFQPCSYSHNDNVMTISASQLTAALGSNYTNQDIEFQLIWRKNSSTSSDELGTVEYDGKNSIPHFQVRYLDVPEASFTRNHPTCHGRTGSATFHISNLPPAGTTVGGTALYYIATVHQLTTIQQGNAEPADYIAGVPYYRTGEGLTTGSAKSLPASREASISLYNLSGGHYQAVVFFQVGNTSTTQEFCPLKSTFKIVEPTPINLNFNNNPYCKVGDTEYLLPAYGTTGNRIRLNPTCNYGDGSPMPLEARRMIGNFESPYYDVIPSDGTSFVYSTGFPFGSDFYLQVVNTDDETCKSETTIALLNAPRLYVTVVSNSNIPAACPVNSESAEGTKRGEIEFRVTGGCGSNYRYRFANTDYENFSNDSPNNLHLTYQAPGDYTVYFNDYTNTVAVNYTISSPDSLKYSYHIQEPKCPGADAIMTIDSVPGFGNAPYLIYQDDSVNLALTPKEVSIPANTATRFVIRDNRSCALSFVETTMPAPDSITTSNVIVTPTSCSTRDNGSVQLDIAGGTPNLGNYTVSFQGQGDEVLNRLNKHYLSAGAYSLSVQDSNHCRFDTTITIPVNPLPIQLATPGTTGQYCDSVVNGSVSAQVGQLSYASDSFQWNLYTMENTLTAEGSGNLDEITLSGLRSGNYWLQVVDDSLCADSTTISIELNPTQFDFALLTPTNTMCEGINTGTLNVAVAHAGNNENYYALSGIGGRAAGYFEALTSGTSGLFEELIDGRYHIRVEDSAGCVIHSEATVAANPNPVRFSMIDIEPKYCDSVPGGTLRMATSHNQGGSIERIWIPTAPGYDVAGDRATFENLGNASEEVNWQVYVRGTYGCENDTVITISNIKNNPVAHITLIDSLACTGLEDGAIELTAQQGVVAAPYTFTLNGVQQQTGADARFTNLDGTTEYTLRIEDTIGCTHYTAFRVPVISEPLHITLDSTVQASCNRAANARYYLSARGGKPSNQDYTFMLEGLEEGALTLRGRDVVFEDLPTYTRFTYQVSDTDDCVVRRSTSRQILARNDSLDFLNHGIRDASCPENADGRADLQTRFGNAFWYGYEYALYHAGDESLMREFTDNAHPDYSGLAPGSYRAEVEDADSCWASEAFTIGAPDPVTLIATPGYVARKGDATGWASAALDAGNEQYRVEWYVGYAVNAGQLLLAETTDSLTTLENLTTGNYLLRVSDTAGCQFWGDAWLEENIYVHEPVEALSISLEQATDVSCNGLSDGSIDVSVQGGWGNDHQVGLDKDNMDAVTQINALPTGTYWVFVQDTAGVFDSLTVFIDQPEVLEASVADLQHITCYNYSNGSISLTITGGNSPYEVSANAHSWVTGAMLGALPAGTHTIYVRDSLGCTTNSQAILTEPEGMEITDTTVIGTQCGAAEGLIEVTPAGGTPEYSYSWTNLEGEPVVGNALIENLLSGVYNLQLTDDNGCTQDFRFHVSDITDLEIQNWNIEAVNCWGDANGSAFMEVVRGFPPYTVTWPDSTGASSVANLEAGVYLVSVEDDEGCRLFESFTIPTPDSVSIGSLLREDPLCQGVADGELEVEAAGGTPNYSYQWSTGREQAGIGNLAAGRYALTITDAHGCSKSYNWQLMNQTEVETELMDSVSICYGNAFPLDPGAFYRYHWTADGTMLSEERVLRVEEPGVYVVEVEDGYGCIGSDSTEIHLSETEFVAQAIMASEIYMNDTVAIFETSRTVPDSLEYHCSEGLEINEQGSHYCYIVPADTGLHSITIIAHRDDCIDIQQKTVRVLPGSSVEGFEKLAAANLIQGFTLFPNPNDGNFEVGIYLAREADATLRLLSHSGIGVLHTRKLKGSSHYTAEYRLNGLHLDVYVLFLEVEDEVQSIKFIML